MKSFRVWILVALGLGALALVLFVGQRGEGAVELLVKPTLGDFKATVTTTGELQAKNSVMIYGPSNARQARIYEMSLLELVDEGTVVQKGQFVAELDRSELNSKIKDSEIDLQKAASQFTQTKLDTSLTLSKAREERVNLRYAMEEARLRSEESVYEPPSVRRKAEIDYEKAKRTFDQSLANYQTQVQQAEAKMSEVEAELQKAQRGKEELVTLSEQFTINAPENGMVIYKRDWRGQKLTAGGKVNSWDPVVATLPDLSVMESRTYVNEVDIQRIKLGQRAEIGLDADPGKKLAGKVTEIANIGEQRPNSDAKVFEVKLEITETDSTLRPAMTTSNMVTVAERSDVLYVPLETVHSSDSLSVVFVKDGGDVVRQEVRLGLMNENEVIVEAGLSPEDELYLATPVTDDDTEIRRLPPEAPARVMAEESTDPAGTGFEGEALPIGDEAEQPAMSSDRNSNRPAGGGRSGGRTGGNRGGSGSGGRGNTR